MDCAGCMAACRGVCKFGPRILVHFFARVASNSRPLLFWAEGGRDLKVLRWFGIRELEQCSGLGYRNSAWDKVRDWRTGRLFGTRIGIREQEKGTESDSGLG